MNKFKKSVRLILAEALVGRRISEIIYGPPDYLARLDDAPEAVDPAEIESRLPEGILSLVNFARESEVPGISVYIYVAGRIIAARDSRFFCDYAATIDGNPTAPWQAMVLSKELARMHFRQEHKRMKEKCREAKESDEEFLDQLRGMRR